MQIDIYNHVYQSYFNTDTFKKQLISAVDLIKTNRSIYFIGNGGSNSICSHMMEDFAKILKYKTYAFSDPALITCFSNDYGYEYAMKEWLDIYSTQNEILVAISSSGNSPNIINAVNLAKSKGMKIVTLSGFKRSNQLTTLGDVNFHIDAENYGVVECFHQVIIHSILDEINASK